MQLRSLVLTAALAVSTSLATADTITFKNGDKLTGKITTMEGGKMKVASAVAGEVTVDLKDVATFSTDAPVAIHTADGKKLNAPVASGDAEQVKVEGQAMAIGNIAKINPPPQEWTGSVVGAVAIARGNTSTDTYGLSIDAQLRRKDESHDDRITLGGAYNLSRQRDALTGDKVSSADNWLALGKYDRFWTPHFYGYGIGKVEHDLIAQLNYRLAPGVGLGFQWIETPAMNFNTEGGITYVYEDYVNDGSDDAIALRLAYHFDKKLNDRVMFFHNAEWLPAFDDPGDYNLTMDAGIRADITKTFFTEVKAEWKRDSTPAPGSLKNDMRYLVGLGWKF